MNHVYASLLADMNIHVTDIERRPELVLPSLISRCCDVISESEGYESCQGCGRVFNATVFETPPEYAYTQSYRHENQKPLGSAEHWYQERRRFYKPLTHFRQHLRSYLGARMVKFDRKFLRNFRGISVSDPRAYQQVKDLLRKIKKPGLYKDIFTILYRLGAPMPKFTAINEICDRFKNWYYIFSTRKLRYGGHNTPSMHMLLDLFLKQFGQPPFFVIPYLKSDKLRQKILTIFDDVNSELPAIYLRRSPVSQDRLPGAQ